MKFSEVDPGAWEELRPYLDTCLIPLSGLRGTEQPYEVTEKLAQLRDVMDWVEAPFHGRVVTYPSFQYGGPEIATLINEVCRRVKQSGFRYVIVTSAEVELDDALLPEADLIITPRRFAALEGETSNQRVKKAIQRMWQADRKS